MSEPKHPGCEWVGMADDMETVAICGRAAQAVIADHMGGLHYACRDHVSEIKAKVGTGTMTIRPLRAVARPFPESIP
jgi:hypothetical protein